MPFRIEFLYINIDCHNPICYKIYYSIILLHLSFRYVSLHLEISLFSIKFVAIWKYCEIICNLVSEYQLKHSYVHRYKNIQRMYNKTCTIKLMMSRRLSLGFCTAHSVTARNALCPHVYPSTGGT